MELTGRVDGERDCEVGLTFRKNLPMLKNPARSTAANKMILIPLAISCFISTNLDGLTIMITLFAQADLVANRMMAVHICVGQLLGFTAICCLSMLVAWLGNKVFPPGYIQLIGIFPFLMGVWNLFLLCTEPDEDRQGYQDIPDEEDATAIVGHIESLWFLHSEVFEVAALVMASGGDNIAIYAALFVSKRMHSLSKLLTVLVTFYCMLLLFLIVAYNVTHIHSFHELVKKYGRRVVPFVWIVIGLYILSQSVVMDAL